MAQAGAIRMKVPRQRPGSHGQGRIGLLAVTVAHGIQDPIQLVVHASHRVGRAGGLRTVIGAQELGPVARHFRHRLGHRPVEGGARPLPQTAQALGELRFRHGLIDEPGALEYLVAPCPPAPLGEFADGVQEAEYQDELRHEPPPGLARGLELVRTHRTHSIGGKDRSGFGNKLPVGVLQALTVGLLGHTDAQHTAPAYGGRDYDFGPRQPRELLIGNQILGQGGAVLDRGPDQIRTPEAEPRPIPKHRIAPKDIGQGRKWHAPLPQVERFLDLVGPRNAIGHQKGGPHREDLQGGLELDPSQHTLLFARLRAVMEGIAVVQRLRKQFRMLLGPRRQVLTILRHIFHTCLIVRFTRKRHADMFVATGWGMLLRLCVAHHSTVWRIFAPPSPLFFPLLHKPQNPLEPGTLDYVTAWFLTAGAYLRQLRARIGFVSTNSITQGEQVAQLWPLLFARYGLEITFAHRTFAWGSDARGMVHVHVVIIGLCRRDQEPPTKRLFSYDDIHGDPTESVHAALTPYLFDAGSVINRHLVVEETNRPLCEVPQLIIGSKPIDEGNYISRILPI